jgi:hypothetical protein
METMHPTFSRRVLAFIYDHTTSHFCSQKQGCRQADIVSLTWLSDRAEYLIPYYRIDNPDVWARSISISSSGAGNVKIQSPLNRSTSTSHHPHFSVRPQRFTTSQRAFGCHILAGLPVRDHTLIPRCQAAAYVLYAR